MTNAQAAKQATNTPALVASAAVPMKATSGGGLLSPQNLSQVVEAAKLLAQAGPAVPKHCRGNPGVCFAIMLRAMRWNMDPVAVAQGSYVVNDQIAYMAQVIHAAVNVGGGLKDLLEVEYSGEGPERTCKIIGTFKNGAVREYVSPKLKDIKIKNSPLWTSDPDQQLFYYSSRAWARRWCPEVIQGAYTREEILAGASADDPDRAILIEHDNSEPTPRNSADVLDDEPFDGEEPGEMAPLGARMAWALERCSSEDEVKAVLFKFQPEIDAAPEQSREPLRKLYGDHLHSFREGGDREATLTRSREYRERLMKASNGETD